MTKCELLKMLENVSDNTIMKIYAACNIQDSPAEEAQDIEGLITIYHNDDREVTAILTNS